MAEKRLKATVAAAAWALALMGMAWIARDTFAAGEKVSGTTKIVDDLSFGSAGTAKTASGTTEVMGSLGQVGTVSGTSGATTLDAGYFAFPAQAGGVTRTWDGGGTTDSASEAANWSANTLPATDDEIRFDATSTKNCTFDIALTLSSVAVLSGYTGGVSISSQIIVNKAFDVLSQGATVFFLDSAANKHILSGPVTVASATFHIGQTTVVAIGSITVRGGGILEMHDAARFEGTKIHVKPGTAKLKLFDNNLVGAPVLTSTGGFGAHLEVILDGQIDISSAVFERLGSMGIQIGDIATFINFSSFTFKGPLEPGTTAIFFDVAGPNNYVSTFTNINFADANIGINVNAFNLGPSASLTFQKAKGPKAGPAFENDPGNKVAWLNQAFGVASIGDLTTIAVTTVGATRLNWTWPETLAAGASFYIQYSTNAGADWLIANAQVTRPTGPVTAGAAASYIVGGLDVGRDGSDLPISPTYNFRVFITSGPGAESGPSNIATGSGALPGLLTNAFTNLGGAGTAGGGWLSTFNDSVNLSDGFIGAARDGAGNIYVSGAYQTASNAQDFLLRKYTSAGTILWTKYFNNADNTHDEVAGIAADSSGNVYAVGASSIPGQDFNAFVRKYDTNGALLWEATHNGADNSEDLAEGVAVDSSGNVYAGGYEFKIGQHKNAWLRKYNAAGLVQWTTTYNNGSTNLADEIHGVAVSGTGVYVAGEEQVGGQGNNIWVRKYDSLGTLVSWTTTYTSPGAASDKGLAIDLDSSGNVYVAGYETVSGQGDNIWVRKYDSASPPNAVWTHAYNGPFPGGSDNAQAIAAHESGVYVTGFETGAAGNKDIWVRKLSLSAGLAVWTTTYQGSDTGNEEGAGIVVDASSNVYVAGLESVLSQSNNGWLRRFNADAFLAGVTDLSASPGSYAGAVNISFSYPEALPAGSKFFVDYTTFTGGYTFGIANAEIKVVTGAVTSGQYQTFTVGGLHTRRDGADTNNSPSYFLTVFLQSPGGVSSPASNLASQTPFLPGILTTATFTNFGGPGTPGGGWLQTVNGPNSGDDRGWSIMHNNTATGILAVGTFNTGTGNDDIFARLYDTNGNTDGTVYYNNPKNGNDVARGVWVNGNYGYVVGAENRNDGKGDDLLLQKYDVTNGIQGGMLEWTTTYNSPDNLDDYGAAVTVDGGFIYVAGFEIRSGQNRNILVQKYDLNGLLLWTTSYNNPANGLDQGIGIAAQGGAIYVSGEESVVPGFDTNLWLRKYDSNALVQWTTSYAGAGGSVDRGRAVATDGPYVYVAGDEIPSGGQRDAILLKYDSLTAGLLLKRTHNGAFGGDDVATGVALDGDNVYLSGSEAVAAGDVNIWVRKYSKGGLIEWTTTYAGPANGIDEANGLHVSLASNVFVTGYERKSNAQFENIWVRKFNADAFAPASAGNAKIWAGSGIGFASNGSNWIGGFAPVNGDYVIFGATSPTINAQWDITVTLSSITFKDGYKGNVDVLNSLTVNGPFEMMTPGTTIQFVTNSSNKHTLNGPVTISSGAVFHIGGTTVVAIGSVTANSSGLFEMHDAAFFQGTELKTTGGSSKGRIKLFDNNSVGPPVLTSTGPAASLNLVFDGIVDITSGVFRRISAPGMVMASGNEVLSLSSITFEGPLAPGSTAINFDVDLIVKVATFTNITFADPNIAVNFNATGLGAASKITMRDAKGSQAGENFDNDPSNLVDWVQSGVQVPPITNLSAAAGPNVGSVKLTWSWAAQLNPGSTFGVAFATHVGAFALSDAAFLAAGGAFVDVATGPVTLGPGGAAFIAGGLDTGHDGAGNPISPMYFFRVFYTSFPAGVESPDSNQAASSGTAPTPLTTDSIPLGAPGTPGGGWLSKIRYPSFTGTEEINDVARDSAGNVYAAGQFYPQGGAGNADNLLLRKYDSGGVIQWTRYYNSEFNLGEYGFGVAVGPSNEVYVVGSSSHGPKGYNGVLFRYNSGGLLEWSTTYDRAGRDDDFNAVAADASGVYVAGAHRPPGPGPVQDIFVRKYSPNGGELWTQTYNGAAGFDDFARGVAVYGGFVYVAGSEVGAGPQGRNIWLRKYDASNGSPVWTRLFSGSGSNINDTDEIGEGVAVDAGGVYLIGRSTEGVRSGDIVVKKLDFSGGVVWTSSFTNTPGLLADDDGLGIAVEGGGVYAVGQTSGTGVAADAWIRKYDTNGLIQWTTTYNSPGNNNDVANAVAVDSGGAVYVGGREKRLDVGEGDNAWLRKFNADAFGGGAGGGVQTFVQSVPTAPPTSGQNANDLIMLRLKLWTAGGSVSMTQAAMSLLGDAPAGQVNAAVFFDANNNNLKDPGEFRAAVPFAAGAPPKAVFNIPAGDEVLTATTRQYLIGVSFSSVAAGKTLELALDFPADLVAGAVQPQGFPHRSGVTKVQAELFAKPSGQLPVAYSTPTSPAGGGFDTGLYINPGQQVSVQTSGSWSPDGTLFFGANGDFGGNCVSCVITSTNTARLMGRIGTGTTWFAMGTSSTFTVTTSGNLFLAMNDSNYGDNAGSLFVTYNILPSAGVKVWIGGNAFDPNRASLDANWAGGQKPFNGERVRFATSTFDCNWDISNITLGGLEMTTDYAKILRLVNPSGVRNTLAISTHVTMERGTFDLGGNNTLEVQGLLTLRSSATLDMGPGKNEFLSDPSTRLRTKGLKFEGAAFWRNNISTTNSAAFLENVAGAGLWDFDIRDATVTVQNHGPYIRNSSGLTLHNRPSGPNDLMAKINALDMLTFDGEIPNSKPSFRIHHGASNPPLNLTFREWEFLAPHVSTNVSYFDQCEGTCGNQAMPSGSNITFLDASGGRLGTPFESDPKSVIFWSPDGGGLATINGTANYAGSQSGDYRVLVTTDASGQTQGVGQNVKVSSGVAFSITSLPAPNTYYVFAFKSVGLQPSGKAPRGGLGNAGAFRSNAVFVGAGGTANGVNITLQDWGSISGNITLNTGQAGSLRVDVWQGDPPCAVCTLEASILAPVSGGPYFVDAPPFTGLTVISYVDVDNDKVQDNFEAFGSSSPVAVSGLTDHSGTNITVGGGSAQSGGTVYASTLPVHGGAISAFGTQPVLRLKLFSFSANSTLNSLKVEAVGNLPAGGGGGAAGPGGVFIDVFDDDNNDGVFQFGGFSFSCPGCDDYRGTFFATLSSPTGNILFSPADNIIAGSTRTLFLTIDPAGNKLASIGVQLSTSSNVGLSAGAMAVQAGLYPIISSAPVRFKVPADFYAQPDNTGGVFTGFAVFPGQTLTVTASGVWASSPSANTSPTGHPNTQGLNSVLTSTNVGTLIGRIQPFSPPATGNPKWFAVGKSSTAVVPIGGELVLAMNDLVGSYTDNSGFALADFSVSGSTLGAIAGTVFYSGGITGSMDVTAVDGNTGVTKATTTISVGAPTSYSYSISGLAPGPYSVRARHQVQSSHQGDTVQASQVSAGSTTTINVNVSLGIGTISGTLSYSASAGVNSFGSFVVAVTTHTDFGHDIVFFGTAALQSPGAFIIGNLQAPNTYYLVGFRDFNNNKNPDGAEPTGAFDVTSPSATIANFQNFLTPIFVPAPPGTMPTGKNITLRDNGAINGTIGVSSTVTSGVIVLRAAHGLPGSPGFLVENREFVRIFPPVPSEGFYYTLDLLRPATDYNVFAFLDQNGNEAKDPSEPFFNSLPNIAVSSGAFTGLNFFLTELSSPPAVPGFHGVAALNGIDFRWNLVPGATQYELRTGANALQQVLLDPTSSFFQSLPPNTASVLTRITAANPKGSSPPSDIGALFSLAAQPASPVVDSVGQNAAAISWTANANPAGTLYEVQRATGVTQPGIFLAVATTTAVSFNDVGLAPAATYFWRVRGRNGNSVFGAFSGQTSGVTNPATVASIGGTVSYAGKQAGSVVVEANTSANFSTTTISARSFLTNIPSQSYFLAPLSAGTHFVRAYVDADVNGARGLGEDQGVFGSPTGIVVAASPVTGQNFTVSVDTVPPGAPSGLAAAASFGKVTLSWSPPLKSADLGPLNDLLGFKVQRSTGTGFGDLSGNLSSATVSFTDLAPVADLSNSYRVFAFDFGQNVSSPTAPKAVTPDFGGKVTGFMSTFTATSAGVFRVRLSTSPRGRDPFQAEAALGNQGLYSFTGLSTNTYYVRGFRDLNNDNVQQNLNEPSGTFGGISAPFPVYIFGNNTVSGANVAVCDRTQALPNTKVSGAGVKLETTDCPAKDQGPGFFTDLYSFVVGGGGTGSIGVGSELNISVGGLGNFDPVLYVLSPDGFVAAQNIAPPGGAASVRLFAHTTGTWLIEPTSFNPGQTGLYSLGLSVVGGFAGGINGTLSYAGSKPGMLKVQLFTTADPKAIPIQQFDVSAAAPFSGPYGFPGLTDGTYYVRAFKDVNGNFYRDAGEPAGALGSESAPTSITITGGVSNLSGPADLNVSDPSAGVVKGTLLYTGSQPGAIRVEIGTKQCPTCEDILVGAFASTATIGGSPFSYIMDFVAPATSYILKAYVDGNKDLRADVFEAKGSSSPVTVTANSTTTANIELKEPGSSCGSGNATLRGTISYGGTATGTINIAITQDQTFGTIDCVETLASPGVYTKSGILGGATYFMAAFRDTNNNGNPDDHLGEPLGLGATENFVGIPSFDDPPKIFLGLTALVTANLTLNDPPGGQIKGQVSYSSASLPGAPIIVQAFIEGQYGQGSFGEAQIFRQAGTTHYLYALPFLNASQNFRLIGWVDANFNHYPDNGEPFRDAGTIAVSSGTGSPGPTTQNFVLTDTNSGVNFGQIDGAISYSGSFSSGPFVVRFFTDANFLGAPEATLTVPAPTPTGTFFFSKGGLVPGGAAAPFVDYFVDAFRDATLTGVLNKAYQPYGKLNGGAAVTLSPNAPIANIGTGAVDDPGGGGSGALTISGSVNYQGTKTCLAAGCRVRSMLFAVGPVRSDSPMRFADVAFAGASAVPNHAYNFTNLTNATHTYRSQHFLDLDNSFLPDAGEPIIFSTAAGIPLGGNVSVGSQNYRLCDRTPITVGVEISSALAPSDCRSPDRAGAFQKLFTFSGTRGQPVTVEMTAIGFSDSYLTLYDPNGSLLASDDESAGNGNARITGLNLPLDGIYTIGAVAYQPGVTGAFKLNFSGSAGSVGSIAGTVEYGGSQGGVIGVGVFKSTSSAVFTAQSFGPQTFVAGQPLLSTRAFSFPGLLTGTSYYLAAFIDINANQAPDAGEDKGFFGAGTDPSSLFLQNGQNITGAKITIATQAVAGLGILNGNITYAGSQGAGKFLRVEISPRGDFSGAPAAFREFTLDAVPGVYPYDASAPGNVDYYLRAFIDLNGNFLLDPNEPKGVFAPAGRGAESKLVPAGGSAFADFTILDPFINKTGQIAGQGAATLNFSSVPAGGQRTFTLTYTADAGTGIAVGGRIGIAVPQGFAFPFNTSQTGAAGTLSFSGPSISVTLTAAMAPAAVKTITFDTFAPCVQGASTFTVVSSSGAGIAPAPLIALSPVVRVTTGAASFFQPRTPYFSAKVGARSEEQVLDAYDACGNKTQITNSVKIATLTALSYNFLTGGFASDATVGLSSSPALSTTSVLELEFAVGRSSRAFQVLAVSTGPKTIAARFDLTAPTTFFYGFTALPSDALTGVSVATAPFGVARSSITIFPGDPTKANQAFFNFTLGDPAVSWRVAIATATLDKAPVLWERYGFGRPGVGEISWDGTYSPFLNNGARVPSRKYVVTVEVAGGVRDETLTVDVNSPELRGTVFDRSGTRLPGAAVDAFGPFGGGRVESGADGGYILSGLVAGSYRLFLNKPPDYLPGEVAVVVTTGIPGFSAVSDAVLASTEAGTGSNTGKTFLNLFMKAPAKLTVTASGVGIATSAFDRWGGLQVRPSTACSGLVSGKTHFGPLRLKAGTTVFDDGGAWDPATAGFVERTDFQFKVTSGTYAAEGFFEGFKPSCSTGAVTDSGGRIDLAAFTTKASVKGTVSVPANPNGTFISVNAVPFSTTTAAQPGFGGVFLDPTVLTGSYTVSNLEPGAYLLQSNVPGFLTITSGPIVLAASEQKGDIHFPTFNTGASITGTATIQPVTTGRTLKLTVSAWSPGSNNFGTAEVTQAGGGVNTTIGYTIPGLQSNSTYQIYAHLGGVDDMDPGVDILENMPLTVLAGGVGNFTFGQSSGVIVGSITIPSNDFGNVSVFGEITASLRPQEVGHTFEFFSSTNLPNFACAADGLPAAAATGICPVGSSSATFRVTGLGTETLDLTVLYRTSGQSAKRRVSVVSGSTSTISVNLTTPTFVITGLIDNQVANTLFKSSAAGAAANILANAAYVDLTDAKGNKVAISPVGVPVSTASLARILAVRQELNQFNLAISTVFNPAVDRVGYLHAAGSYTIANVPPGTYFVRTANLRLCATCATLVPAVGQLVRVSDAGRSSINFTLTDGFSISGTIKLDEGIEDSRTLELTVLNRRREVVRRSTEVFIGDPVLEIPGNSVSYELANLPAGEFYTLEVKDLAAVPGNAYAAQPIKVPDASDSEGLKSNKTGQDLTLQRAAFIVGRLQDANSLDLITKDNASLLAPNFQIRAVASPFFEGGFVVAGSSVSGRPIQADGFFRVGPLIPKDENGDARVYDLKLSQLTWDPNFLSQGSQNYAPVTLSGRRVQPGEIHDVGVVQLSQGTSLTGTVRQSSNTAGTGLVLGNIKISGKPSFGQDAIAIHTFTNASGKYNLWVSTAISEQYDVTAAPRDGNLASNGLYYLAKTLRSVSLLATTTADFDLEPLTASVTGQVAVEDKATGGELSYPFGDQKGFPAAALNLQDPRFVPVLNPLGDIEAVTDGEGKFEIPGLSTGVYHLRVTSLGYRVAQATVTVTTTTVSISTLAAGTPLPGSLITLVRGASISGRIEKEGTKQAPSEDDIKSVAAINFAAKEYVLGTVDFDPTAKTANTYQVSGLKSGISYDMVILPRDESDRPILPKMDRGNPFTVSSDTENATGQTLTIPAQDLDCQADSKAVGGGKFQVKIDCTAALRKKTAYDDDASQFIFVSSFTSSEAQAPLSANVLHTGGDSTGSLLGPKEEAFPSGRELEGNRRKITVIYKSNLTANSGKGEFAFSLRLIVFSAQERREADQALKEIKLDKTFTFFTGLDSHAEEDCHNANNCNVSLAPSQDDDNSKKNERSKLAAKPGTFAGTGGAVCSSCATSIGISKSTDQAFAETLPLGMRAGGVKPHLLPNIPSELASAMNAFRVQAGSNTIGGATALSAFYAIFLPRSIAHQLQEPADLTLSFVASSSDTSNINVWYFTTAAACPDGSTKFGNYCKETKNRSLDADNNTITVTVDHLSTFVVADGTPDAFAAGTLETNEIIAFSFPNPGDCITHTGLAADARVGGLVGGGAHAPFSGVRIRVSLPKEGVGRRESTQINIYNVAGERVRTMDVGQVEGGKTFYKDWNCGNNSNATVASGVYFAEIVWGSERKFIKIAIVKGSGL